MTASAIPSFLDDYLDFVQSSRNADYDDNYDTDRFGPPTRLANAPLPLQHLVRALRMTRRRQFSDALLNLKAALTGNLEALATDQVETDIAQWNWLYGKLADDESRSLLIKLLAYRALGHRKVKLPLSNPEYWKAFAEAGNHSDDSDKLKTKFMQWEISKFDLNPLDIPLFVYTRQINILTDFMIDQYRGVVGPAAIQAEEGDTVIDAGACWGDTALHFAHKVGPTGKVISFEFLPENVEIFQRNVNSNPEPGRHVELVKHPLWSSANKEVHIAGFGPAASVQEKPTSLTQSFITTTIDDEVRKRGISKVNFIKMDIEGAELEALKGARETLLSSRPKLAICVYHRLSDFWSIPQFLEELNCDYEFYIRHFTIHSEETVLFARARQ